MDGTWCSRKNTILFTDRLETMSMKKKFLKTRNFTVSLQTLQFIIMNHRGVAEEVTLLVCGKRNCCFSGSKKVVTARRE